MSILRVSKPGSTFFRFCSVRTSRPAPARMTMLSATCTTTSQLPAPNRPLAPWAPRKFPPDPSFNIGVKSTRKPRNAGAKPNRIPVRIDTTAVNKSTCVSMSGWNDDTPSWFVAMNATMDSMHQVANRIPTAPPAIESITLSVSSWRRMRPREAPNAKRTAISFCLEAARESSNPATFEHAIRSTIPTASKST